MSFARESCSSITVPIYPSVSDLFDRLRSPLSGQILTFTSNCSHATKPVASISRQIRFCTRHTRVTYCFAGYMICSTLIQRPRHCHVRRSPLRIFRTQVFFPDDSVKKVDHQLLVGTQFTYSWRSYKLIYSRSWYYNKHAMGRCSSQRAGNNILAFQMLQNVRIGRSLWPFHM